MNDAAEDHGSNGINPALTRRLLEEIDDCDARLLSLRGEYMQACKGPRGDIADCMKQAKDGGLNMRAFRAVVKNRRLDKRMAANVERLEPDDQASYEATVAGLGDFCDLPLGQAALRRVRPDGGEAALDSLRVGS